MNTVIIPCFNRPEFLFLTLENILKAKHSEEFVYLFAVDWGFDVRILDVINEFPLEKVVIKRKRNAYNSGKQSHNLLEAYRESTFLSEQYSILLEDDFFINPDFFEWHLKVMEAEPNAFCSIATMNHNTWHETDDDDAAYYYGTRTDYQSWGVCWNVEVLKNKILPHANSSYYTDPARYITKILNQEWLSNQFCEQDGLIRRIRYNNESMPVIFPHKPRAFHAGFYSYHRDSEHLNGSLKDMVNFVREVTQDKERFLKACGEFKDSQPIDLNYEFKYDKPVYKPAKIL